MPRLSVVIPLLNEEESVPHLVDAVRCSLDERDFEWELLLIDDGSVDRTAELIRKEHLRDSRVHLIRLSRNYGQSPATQAGFDSARGDVIVTLDGDLQNDPRDIPRLVEEVEKGYDLVAGYRLRRKDKLITRKIPSRIANWIIRQVTKVDIRDNGCSLKAYRRHLLDGVHLYSDMHRFIPAIAAATTGARITEIAVRHHSRTFGESKYGLSRIFKVLSDLFTIKMIRSFRSRPMVALGGLGTGAAAAGSVALVLQFLQYAASGGASTLTWGIVAVLLFGLAGFLAFLGLICEGALRGSRHGEWNQLAPPRGGGR